MVNFTILQVVLLTLLAFIKHVDYYGIPMIFVNYAVFWGLITGVVMGDWQTGLVIGVTCPISFSFGDVSMEIQPLLDKILPAMIPAAITGSAYYLLTKKNASMTALILVVIVLAMVASAAGILA